MYFKSWIRLAGMHITRPVGQMSPTVAFNMTLKDQNVIYFACFYNKNIIQKYVPKR
jgi:hypothetical protein